MGHIISFIYDRTWPLREPQIMFTTFGMMVLDELHFTSKESVTDVVGGSGTYSTLGARLFSPPPAALSVGWMIRTGNDFPSSVKTQLEEWGVMLLLSEESGRLSTRGHLKYDDLTLDSKQFKYLTPTLDIVPAHFECTPLLRSQSFHILASPLECIGHLDELFRLRRLAGITCQPLIIWEPKPSSCSPENLDDFFRAVQAVDVFSPNHVELAAIFGTCIPASLDHATIEGLASRFLKSGVGASGQGTVIIRAGEDGCFVKSANQPAEWLPAYYEPMSGKEKTLVPSAKVVDPTGAGNAFLGAYAIGFLSSKSVYEGACYGTVASSFALEQIGIPTLSRYDNGEELWNNTRVDLRLHDYRSRILRDRVQT